MKRNFILKSWCLCFCIFVSIQVKALTLTVGDVTYWYDGNSALRVSVYYCTAGGNIIIPPTFNINGSEYTVNAIESMSFQDNTGLTSVTIPNTVTIISNYVFAGCTNLTSINVLRPSTPTVYSNTFSGVDFSKCRLYVPIGSLQNYTNGAFWNQFTNIAEYNPTDVQQTSINSVKVYKDADFVVVKGVDFGKDIKVYTATGMLIMSSKGQNKIVKFKLPAKQVYMIQIENKAYKVAL